MIAEIATNAATVPDGSPAIKNGPPGASFGRYATLDHWRGFAALCLVVFHATMQAASSPYAGDDALERSGQGLVTLASWIWLGVPVFFVISGYCVTATLESTRRRGRGMKEFFRRRFRRIYPPYWIALAVTALVVAIGERLSPGIYSDGIFTMLDPSSLAPANWFGNLTLCESWRPLVGGPQAIHLLPNTWTLCYEEQFYAICTVLLLAVSRRPFFGAAIVTAFAVAAKVVAHRLGMHLTGTFLDGRWLLFASGILVYWRLNYAQRLGRVLSSVVLGGLWALATIDLVRTVGGSLLPNHSAERFWAFGFAFFIAHAHGWDKRWAASKWLAPLAACGARSYSIYLIHPIVVKAVSHELFRVGFTSPWETLLIVVPLSFSLSIAAAWGFHLAVERRFLNAPIKTPAPAGAQPSSQDAPAIEPLPQPIEA